MKLPHWLSSLFADAPADSPRDGLVLVGRPQGEAEAELWRNILSQWGVTCLIKNVSALAYIRLGDMFEVWVREEDGEYACELLGLAGDGDASIARRADEAPDDDPGGNP